MRPLSRPLGGTPRLEQQVILDGHRSVQIPWFVVKATLGAKQRVFPS